MSRPPVIRHAAITSSSVTRTKKAAEAVHIEGHITSGPDKGRLVVIVIQNDRAIKLGNDLIAVASRNIDEQEEHEQELIDEDEAWEAESARIDKVVGVNREPVHQQIKDLGGVDNPEEAFEPEETVTHLNFYEVIEESGSAAVSPVDLTIKVNSSGDWCHVLFNGRIVDQGHIDDVNSRLVQAFFSVQEQPGIDKVTLTSRTTS